MLEKFLKNLGLSEKEVQVYLKLLSVGNISVIELAKLTDINRTTLYPILESLEKKELVSEVKEGKKVRFQAEPPERLETFIENEKSRLAEQEKLLDDVIPQLKGIALQPGEKPIVSVYDGREGILRSIKDYFEAGEHEGVAYMVYPRDLIEEVFSKSELSTARNLRVKKKIKTKSLSTSTQDPRPSDDLGERYTIDPVKYPIKCDIGVYADRIRIHTLGKRLSAIFIRNQDVADTLRTLIDLAIKGAKAEEDNK